MGPKVGRTLPAERLRRAMAPAIALLSSSLLLCCLVTLPDIAVGWSTLSTANARLPGWSGAALVVAVGTAALSLLTCARVGSAPALALGTTAAVLGLALSGDVSSGGQAVLVFLLHPRRGGAHIASGLCMLEELPPRLARSTVIGWLLPWAGGWGALGWLALQGRSSGETRLGVHPPGIALAAGVIVALLWAVTTLVLEPHREPDSDAERVRWETAWAALAVLVVAAGSLVMLIGFQPDLSASWGRPLVLLATALVAGGLVACGTAMPDVAARPAYLAAVLSAATGPTCVHALLLVSAEESGSLSAWVLVVLTAAGLVGVWLGWSRAQAGAIVGLVLVAAAAAAGWVMPAPEWLMAATATPMCLGVAAAVAGGLRMAGVSRMLLRFVSMAGLSGLLLGQIAAAPIAWSLGAELTGTADARAGGRVLLGLTFALSVVAAAVCAVLPTDGPSLDLRGTHSRDPRETAAPEVRP